jgi:hypothetical protein
MSSTKHVKLTHSIITHMPSLIHRDMLMHTAHSWIIINNTCMHECVTTKCRYDKLTQIMLGSDRWHMQIIINKRWILTHYCDHGNEYDLTILPCNATMSPWISNIPNLDYWWEGGGGHSLVSKLRLDVFVLILKLRTSSVLATIYLCKKLFNAGRGKCTQREIERKWIL